MAGWQKAAEIPGLVGGGGPPMIPAGGPPAMGGRSYGGSAGGSLTIDFGIWDFTWRTLVATIGSAFIIPAPWLMVWYIKWLVPCVRVPGRPNLSFEGSAMTIVPWFFGMIVLFAVAGYSGIQFLNVLAFLAYIALYWLFIRWFVANLASSGQLLGLSFSGTPWAFLGWMVLFGVSVITIIGWAWVYAAWLRWFCRNIQGTRREVTFVGTGLEFLWRSIVIAIASSFIIPIPWMYRWKMRWLASQTVLAPRDSM
jgi:hypothetical protein